MWGRGTRDEGRGAAQRALTHAALTPNPSPASGRGDRSFPTSLVPRPSSPNSQPPAPTPKSPRRPAFTLIEILITITLMLMLTVSAIVWFGPAMEDRGVREGARLVTAYLNSARNRAMETGRPCGVIFHRDANATGCSSVLDYCEVPPSYAGDTVNATVTVVLTSVINGVATISISGTFNTDLVKAGDQIRLNGQGPFYTITAASTSSLTATIDVSQGQQVPWTSVASLPVSFSISRSPVNTTRVAVGSLELPAGVVADLVWSGVGTNPSGTGVVSLGNNSVDVNLLFSPDGSVYQITSTTLSGPLVQPLFFLVGKRERTLNTSLVSPVSSSNQDQLPNIQDPNNIWVVINSQTGLITSDVMATATTTSDAIAAATARSLAAQSQGMGGR